MPRATLPQSRQSKKPARPEVLAFMRHPRHARVAFNEAARSFTVDGKRVKGITRWLDEAVIPPSAEMVTFSGCKRARADKDARCTGKGAEHGKLVDEQLQAWVAGGSLAGADPCALRIAVALERLKLRPFACQIMIFDDHARWATAVDCLALNTAGELVLLEFKTTAYPALYTAESVRMRNWMSAYDYSPYTHHQLQVALPMIAMRNLYGAHVAEAYVVVASPPRTVDIYPLQPKYLQAALRHQCLMRASGGSKAPPRSGPACP